VLKQPKETDKKANEKERLYQSEMGGYSTDLHIILQISNNASFPHLALYFMKFVGTVVVCKL